MNWKKYFLEVHISDKLSKIIGPIVKTIIKLEGQIDFNCFLHEGMTFYGYAGEVTEDSYIMLDMTKLSQYEPEVVNAIIAHELAHAFLQHHRNWKEGLEQEEEADALAAKWGYAVDKMRKILGPHRRGG